MKDLNLTYTGPVVITSSGSFCLGKAELARILANSIIFTDEEFAFGKRICARVTLTIEDIQEGPEITGDLANVSKEIDFSKLQQGHITTMDKPLNE